MTPFSLQQVPEHKREPGRATVSTFPFFFFFSLSNERAMLREAVVVEGPPQQGWEGGGAVLPPPPGRMTWRALVGEGNAPG